MSDNGLICLEDDGTVYRFALYKIVVVLSREKGVSISPDYAFDISIGISLLDYSAVHGVLTPR